jgi:hypothetical protein
MLEIVIVQNCSCSEMGVPLLTLQSAQTKGLSCLLTLQSD